jgi:hypothetical protein
MFAELTKRILVFYRNRVSLELTTSPGLPNLWHATFTAFPLFISFTRSASPYCEKYVYIHICLTVYKWYMNYRYYQIILRVKHFNTNRERCEVLTGVDLTVTEPCDTEQNILQSPQYAIDPNAQNRTRLA